MSDKISEKTAKQQDEDYIDQEELEIIEKLRQIDLELYGERKTLGQKAKIIFNEISKKAFFITSVPFYWFIVFKHIVGSFNPAFFVFVVICSIILSGIGGNWGIINAAMR
ncbi:MAG TPA: hypothetical protein VJC00_00835 [Candidatus Nanoarchaeia archaeon]|nr:hypothetical protein [Candidatus Nanoarchaeia archaeon]